MRVLDSVYDKYPENVKGLFLAMRSLILNLSEFITEDIKYGAPCFLYKGKIILFLMYNKQEETYLLLSYGRHLNHDLIGFNGRKSMQSLPLDVNADIPVVALGELFDQLAEAVDQKKKLFSHHQTTKKRS